MDLATTSRSYRVPPSLKFPADWGSIFTTIIIPNPNYAPSSTHTGPRESKKQPSKIKTWLKTVSNPKTLQYTVLTAELKTARDKGSRQAQGSRPESGKGLHSIFNELHADTNEDVKLEGIWQRGFERVKASLKPSKERKASANDSTRSTSFVPSSSEEQSIDEVSQPILFNQPLYTEDNRIVHNKVKEEQPLPKTKYELQIAASSNSSTSRALEIEKPSTMQSEPLEEPLLAKRNGSSQDLNSDLHPELGNTNKAVSRSKPVEYACVQNNSLAEISTKSEDLEKLAIQARQNAEAGLSHDPSLNGISVRHVRSMAGSQNRVYIMQYNDGLKTCIRVPDCGQPGFWTETDARALRSSVLTMGYMKKHMSIPIPEVIAYDLTLNNPIRSPFVMLSFIEGRSLEEVWYNLEGPISLEVRRQNALRSLAVANAELRKIKFHKSGAIEFPSDDHDAPIIGPRFDFNFDADRGKGFDPRNHLTKPSLSSQVVLRDRLNNFRQLYGREELREKYDAQVSKTIGAHLFYEVILDNMPYNNGAWAQIDDSDSEDTSDNGDKGDDDSVNTDDGSERSDETDAGDDTSEDAEDSAEASSEDDLESKDDLEYGAEFAAEDEVFYICHGDQDSQNILVDESGNVTGIIDWDRVDTQVGIFGWARFPHFLCSDWYPDYIWPDSDENSMSPQELEHYRDCYARYLHDAANGEGDSRFTSKTMIMGAVECAIGVKFDHFDPLGKILQQIIPRMDIDGFLYRLGDDGWLPGQKEFFGIELAKLLEPNPALSGHQDGFYRTDKAVGQLVFTGHQQIAPNESSKADQEFDHGDHSGDINNSGTEKGSSATAPISVSALGAQNTQAGHKTSTELKDTNGQHKHPTVCDSETIVHTSGDVQDDPASATGELTNNGGSPTAVHAADGNGDAVAIHLKSVSKNGFNDTPPAATQERGPKKSSHYEKKKSALNWVKKLKVSPKPSRRHETGAPEDTADDRSTLDKFLGKMGHARRVATRKPVEKFCQVAALGWVAKSASK
jgi:hypothetical protein